MNSDEIYLYLSSNDSKKYFPNNKSYEFTVQLPRVLNLDETWSVALTEVNILNYTNNFKELNIYSNIVQHRIVGCQELQLLARIIDPEKQIENPIYLPVCLEDITQVKVSVSDDQGKLLDKDNQVILILHLKKNLSIMEHQTLVLKSTDCMDIFPNNIASHFKVRLPYELQFDSDEYEVGLINFYMDNLWVVEREGTALVKLLKDATGYLEGPDLYFKFKYNVNKNLDDFVEKLNKKSKEWKPKAINALPVYTVESGKLKLLEPGLFFNTNDGNEIEFEYAFDVGLKKFLNNGKSSTIKTPDNIFIHCSIAEPSIVGDTLAPILRVINIKSIGDRVYFDYEKPYYLPLSESLIRDIEITIESDPKATSDNSGKAVVVLDIRRKSILDNNL